MLFDKNKSVFDKINKYLEKKGHELVTSIYLNNYNGNNIYIRLDFVKKLSVYKIVWVDLNYFDEKNIGDYLNIQMLTKFISVRLVERLLDIKLENSYATNDDIKGDRVEILTYFNNETREYVFDRFLPLEWKELIDPLAIVFTYLPRSMEVFLNEIFALFDGTQEHYNFMKPNKFNILNTDLDNIFKKDVISKGEEIYEQDKILFLEEYDGKYFGLVSEEKKDVLVVLKQIDDEYAQAWCSCKKKTYDKHIYAVVKALRDKKFKDFYKVKYVGKEESVLDMVTVTNFHLCAGTVGDKILLVTPEGTIYAVDILQKGKVAFEVIEDDDQCTLSKKLEEFKIK